jgi:hypothetical protein
VSHATEIQLHATVAKPKISSSEVALTIPNVEHVLVYHVNALLLK